MSATEDDAPPPSEDEANQQEEEQLSEDVATGSTTATESALQESEMEVEGAAQASSANQKCSVSRKVTKKVKVDKLETDSLEDFDPDNPPTPMTVLKVPKQFEKFTTKINLHPAKVRAKVAGPGTLAASVNQPKRPTANKEAIPKSQKSKKSGKSGASGGKENSLKAGEAKAKNAPKVKLNSTRPEGKSVRKPKPPPETAVEMLPKVVLNLNAGLKGDPASTCPSPVKPSNTRSILPTPKVRPKMAKKVKVYKTKGKAAATAQGKSNNAKSRFSSRVHGEVKEKSKPEPKRTSLKKPPLSTQPAGPSDMSTVPKVAPSVPERNEAFSEKTNQLLAADKALNVIGKRNEPEIFTNDEMEDINDELTDLNTSLNTLRHSYGSIIVSLMNMQRRRAKKAAALAPVTTNPADANLQAPDSATAEPVDLDDICERVKINYEQKYSLERFLEASVRDSAFKELFLEVNQINCAFARFKSFFNGEGYFQQATYQAQEEYRFTREQYDKALKVIKALGKAVIAILKAYNTDLLDMFRINSSKAS